MSKKLSEKIAFEKPPLELSEFVPLLQKRGLIIEDISELEHDVKFIGYYRLSGYMFPFQKMMGNENTHIFEEGTTYATIKEHYIFDRKLRLHILDAIERIEISLRVAIISRMSNLQKDAFWYLNSNYFTKLETHSSFVKRLEEDIEESSELFLHRYSKKYIGKHPPAWMAFELLSFGMLSRLFDNLKELDQKVIAGQFKMQPKTFKSWMHSLTYVRNLSAHHLRLWNRAFLFTPSISGFEKDFYISNDKQQDLSSFYVRAAIIQILMCKIAPNSLWGENLKMLISDHPSVSSESLGCPTGWEKRSIWDK